MLPQAFARREASRAALERLSNEALPATDLEGVRLRGNARIALGLPTDDVTP
jgi:hypothetical protein